MSPRLASAMTSRPASRAWSTVACERRPAVGAEALEARELRLDRDAGRAGGVDQRGAVRAHRGGRPERWRSLGGRLLERLRPQPSRIGVEPEHDLRLARRDGGGQTVAEAPRLTCGRLA